MRLQPVCAFPMAAILLTAVSPVLAIPTLAIDLDPTTPGVQTHLSVASGTSFDLDVVFIDDGSAPTEFFDTAILAVHFSGAVLGQTGAATAGELAARAPLSAVDSFSSLTVTPGDGLTSIPAGMLGGFDANSGLVGLQSTQGQAFTLNNPGETVPILSLRFTALAMGSSDLAIDSILPGPPPVDDNELAFTPPGTPTNPNPAPVTVPALLEGATVQVTAPAAVPEPAAGLLLAGGLLLLARRRS